MDSNREWLSANGFAGTSPNAVPIFAEGKDGIPVWLPGYGCINGKQRALFIAQAPKGLWLGGGAVMVVVPQGIISIPDRRHGGNAGPTAQGWAQYEEGSSLKMAAFREFTEELVFYTLAGEGDDLYQACTEIVPLGITPKGSVRSLNLKLAEGEVFGEIKFLTWCKNEKDRAWTYVGLWDLRDLPQAHRLRVIWDDDLPQDLHPGSNPRVLDFQTRMEVGRYEGLQGYLPNNLAFHAVLGTSIDKIRA